MPAILINEKNYKKEVKRCKTPVLLSFSACHSVSSFLLRQTADALSDELRGRIKVGVVGSASTGLIKEFDVRFLPMTVLIRGDTVTDRIIGNPGKAGFIKILLE